MSTSRQEIFASSGPVHADVVTKSGNIAVEVWAGERSPGGAQASGKNDDVRLENAELHFDEKSNELLVRTQPHDHFNSLSGLTTLFMKSAWSISVTST